MPISIGDKSSSYKLLAPIGAGSMVMLFMVAPVVGQGADSDQLRELLKSVPQLSVERIDLQVNPPLMLEGISAVTADQRGNIYVIHRPAHGDPIVVLDPKGNFIRSWGQGMFKIPHGIRIDPAGNVWTLDANTSMVYKFTPEGEKLLEIEVGGVPDKTRDFCGATDIAFAKSGHVFVSDGYCNARVIEYDAGGKKVREWGKHGTGPGEFNTVHSIAVGPQGNLYVADRENGRVQWFDQNGKFLGEWKFGGQVYTVAFSQTGEFYAATHPKGVSLDEDFNVVKIDLASGKILGKFGVRSHELAVGPDGTLLPATRSSQLVLLRLR
jgi:DNA-binding beta-propeller fold protein YncE